MHGQVSVLNSSGVSCEYHSAAGDRCTPPQAWHSYKNWLMQPVMQVLHD